MRLSFSSADSFESFSGFSAFIESVIQDRGLTSVAEIGAGANPALSSDFVRCHGIRYVSVDEDAGEIEKGNTDCSVVFDVCSKGTTIPGAPYDFIFGRMTAEHFKNSSYAYENIYRSLRPGGVVIQSFACLGTLPFLVNRITPDRLSDFLLSVFAPRDRVHHDKFKAFYDRCAGPTPSQLSFFAQLGFEILEYRAHFGHDYYKPRLQMLDRLEKAKTRLLLNHPVPRLASYATVVLRRPA